MSKNQPIDKIRFGHIAVTIWENTSSDGKTYHSIGVERTYTDTEGKPQSTSSFGRRDLLTLAEALRVAHGRLYLLAATSDQPDEA